MRPNTEATLLIDRVNDNGSATIEDKLNAYRLRDKLGGAIQFYEHQAKQVKEGELDLATQDQHIGVMRMNLDLLKEIPAPSRNEVIELVLMPFLEKDFKKLTKSELSLLKSAYIFNNSARLYILSLTKRQIQIGFKRDLSKKPSFKNVPHKELTRKFYNAVCELEDVLMDIDDYEFFNDGAPLYVINTHKTKMLDALKEQERCLKVIDKHVLMDWNKRKLDK